MKRFLTTILTALILAISSASCVLYDETTPVFPPVRPDGVSVYHYWSVPYGVPYGVPPHYVPAPYPYRPAQVRPPMAPRPAVNPRPPRPNDHPQAPRPPKETMELPHKPQGPGKPQPTRVQFGYR